jgi:superfamily II DNA or RNA helicase
MFAINEEVEIISNPSCKGTIKEVISSGTANYYRVNFSEGIQSVQILPESDLRKVIDSDSPWENLIAGRFYSYDDYILNSIMHKIENLTDNTISGLKASKVLFKPHQFIPLVKFLKSSHRRLLIADEVGLGKTIEAGHILLELFSRREISRVLVVCTKTLVDKWRHEMYDKFAFPFEEVTSEKMIEFIEGESVPDDFLGIINYEKFSNNEDLQELCKKKTPTFDLIILDEVQKIRNATANHHRALKPLIENAKAVLMLSATPINNKIEDLYNLLQLLDPIRYSDSRNFENDNAFNIPIVKAMNALLSSNDLIEIADELENSKINRLFTYGVDSKLLNNTLGELLENDPLFIRVLDRLRSRDVSAENKILIQRDLTELNSISYLFTRTRKRDVEDKKATRVTHRVSITFSEEESAAYFEELESLEEYYTRHDSYGNERIFMLPVLQKSRKLASSIPAYFKNSISTKDSKFEKLKEILKKVITENKNKIILFAEFKETLFYLEKRLKLEGIESLVITGDNADSRTGILHKYRVDNSVKIIMASILGTEGIDLQFCDAIVNYDLPWNPMVVEQRIGRIDRIGQQSDRIHIYNFVSENTIEADVYDLLLDKIKIFETSIGALEIILDEEDNSWIDFDRLEFEIYSPKLTTKERKERLDQQANALINRRIDLERIESELTDSMVQDLYFKQEISRITNDERYITSNDVEKFLISFIRIAFPQIHYKSVGNGRGELKLNESSYNRLHKFLKNTIADAEPTVKKQLNVLYREFHKRIQGGGITKLFFEQEYAFQNEDGHFVSMFHPIIYAAKLYFKNKGIKRFNAFEMKVEYNDISHVGVPPGTYSLIVSEHTIVK